MSYAAISHFAQTWGLALLLVCFAAALVYALWPGNREKFQRAARAPLEKDDANGGA
ncbi:MAG: cbb3-type cytochrome c oxidase subunit 3 [Hyphomonadaceae bacterium]